MHLLTNPFVPFLRYLQIIALVSLVPILLALVDPAAASARFCIQPILVDESFGKSEYLVLEHVIETETPENDIFFFKGYKTDFIAHLRQNKFVPIKGEFPKRFKDYENMISTPAGQAIGFNRFIVSESRPQFIHLQNSESGTFEKVDIENLDEFDRLTGISWSTPLNAPLLKINRNASNPDRSRVVMLKERKLIPLRELEHSPNTKRDFPILNLTVLASGHTIYIIDGDQKVHDVFKLNLKKWSFVSGFRYLKNPSRIAIIVEGPIQGIYLIQLEKIGNIWRPKKQQDSTDLMENVPKKTSQGRSNGRRAYDNKHFQYYFYGQVNKPKNFLRQYFPWLDAETGLFQVGASQLEKVDETDGKFIKSLPPNVRALADPSFQSYYYGGVQGIPRPMTNSNALLYLNRSTILVVDANGKSHFLDRRLLTPRGKHLRYGPWYLKQRGEVLISIGGNLALLKDRELSGGDACKTIPLIEMQEK